MPDDRYIWCRNCGAIHHVTPFDRAPRYQIAAGEIVAAAANDWREFIDLHSGHRLEPMLATHRDYYPGGSAVDPMAVRYVEITNGSDTLLVRRSRMSIDEPFQYSVANGRLTEQGASLEIQDREIRGEMKLHFSWAPAAPLDDAKIERFLEAFREIVQSLDPDAIRKNEYAGPDERVAYCQLDDATIAALMEKCGSCFEADELDALRRFVHNHRQADDVMALLKRRVLTIEKSSGPAADQTAAPHRP